jgi:hypothetical protein
MYSTNQANTPLDRDQKKAFLDTLTPKAINKVPRAGSKKIGDRSN